MLPILHEPVPNTFIHLDGLYPQGGVEGDQMELVDIGGGVLRWRPTTPTALSASPGMRPKWNGTAIVWGYEYYTIPLVVGNGVSIIAPGMYGGVHISTPGVIVAATCVALDGLTGSIEFDLWRATFPAIPTIANTIVGASPPEIVAGVASQDTILTGWTPTLIADSNLFVAVTSAATFQKVLLSLTVRKS